MTPRTANLLSAVGLAGLLGGVALTAPRWARMLRPPVIPLEEEGAAGAGTGVARAAAATDAEAERTISVKLYFESPDGAGLVPEDRSLPFSNELARQLKTVVQELVRGSTSGLSSPLPVDTKVLEVFVTARGVAFVSLSKEAASAESGSAAELLSVYSIVDSVTANFPAVKWVQILVDDRPVPTLAGHVDISRPLPADMTLVALPAPSPSPSPATEARVGAVTP